MTADFLYPALYNRLMAYDLFQHNMDVLRDYQVWRSEHLDYFLKRGFDEAAMFDLYVFGVHGGAEDLDVEFGGLERDLQD